MPKRQRRRRPLVLATAKKVCSSYSRSKKAYESLSILSNNYKQKYKDMQAQNKNLAVALELTKIERKQCQDETMHYQRLAMANNSLKSVLKKKFTEAALHLDELSNLTRESYYLVDEVAMDQTNEEEEESAMSEREHSQSTSRHFSPSNEESPKIKRVLEKPKRNLLTEHKPNLSGILERSSVLSEELYLSYHAPSEDIVDSSLEETPSETSQNQAQTLNTVKAKIPQNHDEIMVSNYNIGYDKLKESKKKSPMITTRRQKMFNLELADADGIVDESLPTADFSLLDTTLIDPALAHVETTLLIDEDMELTKPIDQFLNQAKNNDMTINLNAINSLGKNLLTSRVNVEASTSTKPSSTKDEQNIESPKVGNQRRKSVRLKGKSKASEPKTAVQVEATTSPEEVSSQEDSPANSPRTSTDSRGSRASKRKTEEIADFLIETRKKSSSLRVETAEPKPTSKKSILITSKADQAPKKKPRVTWLNNSNLSPRKSDCQVDNISPKPLKTYRKTTNIIEETGDNSEDEDKNRESLTSNQSLTLGNEENSRPRRGSKKNYKEPSLHEKMRQDAFKTKKVVKKPSKKNKN